MTGLFAAGTGQMTYCAALTDAACFLCTGAAAKQLLWEKSAEAVGDFAV